MGAQIGKVIDSFKKSQTEIETSEPLEDPPVPPPPDPRIPLTTKQLFNISKSWKGIARAMEPTGITMFVKLFEENEDILHLFQKFQDKRLNELHRESMELAQHASIVMSTLDEGIRTLHNVDQFESHLHSVGKLHRKIPGFQRDYFWRIERPFLAAVQDTLGDRYTENMENIYKITIRYVLDTVVKGFDLGEANSDNNRKISDISNSSDIVPKQNQTKIAEIAGENIFNGETLNNSYANVKEQCSSVFTSKGIESSNTSNLPKNIPLGSST